MTNPLLNTTRSFLKLRRSLSCPKGSRSINPRILVPAILIGLMGLSLPGPWAPWAAAAQGGARVQRNRVQGAQGAPWTQGALSMNSSTESIPISEEISKEKILPPLHLQTLWGISFGGISSSELTEEQLGSFLKIKSHWKMQFNRQLHLHAQLAANLHSERTQSNYFYKSQSSPFSLQEAILKYTPSHWLTLRGGSLNQARLQSQLLVAPWAFPGLFEEIHLLKGEGYTLDLFASQSIPTSQSQNTDRQEREKTPAFFTSGIAFSLPFTRRASTDIGLGTGGTGADTGISPNNPDPEKLQLQFFQYEFQNLPSKAAYESGLRGNNVNQIASGQRAQFRSPFAGYSFQGQLGYKIHPQWTLHGGYEHLKNNRANSLFAQGELLEGKIFWHSLNRKYRWESAYGIFYNEADSSPAIYNNQYLGHNNRQGSFWKFSFHWPDYSLHARYWNHNTLYTTPYHGEKNTLYV